MDAKDIQGLKYLRVLKSLLESLHKVGTERDSIRNRTLHMDHYCMMVLSWMHSPLKAGRRRLRKTPSLSPPIIDSSVVSSSSMHIAA